VDAAPLYQLTALLQQPCNLPHTGTGLLHVTLNAADV